MRSARHSKRPIDVDRPAVRCLALREASPLTRMSRSESFLKALAAAERIKPVCEAQIDVDDFKVSIPVALKAGGAVHERFAACWTVALLGLSPCRKAPGS